MLITGRLQNILLHEEGLRICLLVNARMSLHHRIPPAGDQHLSNRTADKEGNASDASICARIRRIDKNKNGLSACE